jgi:hypothetical protein
MCAVALWHRLLGRPASENGTLCRGAGTHEGGTRRRRVLMLPILILLVVFDERLDLREQLG